MIMNLVPTQSINFPTKLITKHKNNNLTCNENSSIKINNNNNNIKERVFFLDVNPLCYKGSTPSLHSFIHWISLFLSQVSLSHPVIAVFDGEGGHQHRQQILPSYKAHRIKFFRRHSTSVELPHSPAGRSQQLIAEFLKDCNVPAVTPLQPYFARSLPQLHKGREATDDIFDTTTD